MAHVKQEAPDVEQPSAPQPRSAHDKKIRISDAAQRYHWTSAGSDTQLSMWAEDDGARTQYTSMSVPLYITYKITSTDP